MGGSRREPSVSRCRAKTCIEPALFLATTGGLLTTSTAFPSSTMSSTSSGGDVTKSPDSSILYRSGCITSQFFIAWHLGFERRELLPAGFLREVALKREPWHRLLGNAAAAALGTVIDTILAPRLFSDPTLESAVGNRDLLCCRLPVANRQQTNRPPEKDEDGSRSGFGSRGTCRGGGCWSGCG